MCNTQAHGHTDTQRHTETHMQVTSFLAAAAASRSGSTSLVFHAMATCNAVVPDCVGGWGDRYAKKRGREGGRKSMLMSNRVAAAAH